MKNQTDLIERMAKLMDSIEDGSIDADKASAIIKAADVVVQVAKTEAQIYAASRGAMRPAFMALEQAPDVPAPARQNGSRVERLPTPEEAAHERERVRNEAVKAERVARLGRV